MSRTLLICVILTAGCEGCARPTPATTEEPASTPEPVEPEPVYTSKVCCVTKLTCTTEDANPLGTPCACPGPDGELQGHTC